MEGLMEQYSFLMMISAPVLGCLVVLIIPDKFLNPVMIVLLSLQVITTSIKSPLSGKVSFGDYLIMNHPQDDLPLWLVPVLMIYAIVNSWSDGFWTKRNSVAYLMLNIAVVGLFMSFDLFTMAHFLVLAGLSLGLSKFGNVNHRLARLQIILFYLASVLLLTIGNGNLTEIIALFIIGGILPFHTWLFKATKLPFPLVLVLLLLLPKAGVIGMNAWVGPDISNMLSVFPWIAWPGILGFLYFALLALASKDLKTTITLFLVSQGSWLVSFLIISGGDHFSKITYFVIVEALLFSVMYSLVNYLENRTGSTNVNFYSGLFYKMPKWSLLLILSMLISLIFPVLIPINFTETSYAKWNDLAYIIWLILCLMVIIWTLHRMMLGKIWLRDQPEIILNDLTIRESLTVAPFMILTLIILLIF